MSDAPTPPPDRSLERWLAAAEGDAERRALPALTPLLQGLAASTRVLRRAPWNDHADGSGEDGGLERQTRS